MRKFGRGNFRIKIFGRGELPFFATKIVAENIEFESLGFVPDLNHVLSGCHALIAPIEAPVGNRSRILTALANGLPVIAHTNTTLGNPDLISGINCCLGRNADEMLEHFYTLLNDHDYADRIAENGRQLYLDKFHPLVACKALLQRIASAAAGH
jgi:glycosyltransferase involved in cell wall biosynthesis